MKPSLGRFALGENSFVLKLRSLLDFILKLPSAKISASLDQALKLQSDMAFLPQFLTVLFIFLLLSTLASVNNATKVKVNLNANKRSRTKNSGPLITVTNSRTNTKLSTSENVLSSKISTDNINSVQKYSSSPAYSKKQLAVSESVQQYIDIIKAPSPTYR